MNYHLHYQRLMERSPKIKPKNIYTERHRIIPGCMGGKYVKGNFVYLTPEEHYVAHQLLVKIYPECPELIVSAHMMTVDHNGKRTHNKLFGWIRRNLAIQARNRKLGQKDTEETRKKKSISGKKAHEEGKITYKRGYKHDQLHNQRVAAAMLGNKRGLGNKGNRGKSWRVEDGRRVYFTP